jgi:hypothetical protein
MTKQFLGEVFTFSSTKLSLITTRGMSHGGLALRQKKNNENSNISPCKNIIFKKIL